MRNVVFTSKQREARVSAEIDGAHQAESTMPGLGGGIGYLQRGKHQLENGAAKCERISDALDRTAEILAVAGGILALAGNRRLGLITAGAAVLTWGAREVAEQARVETRYAELDMHFVQKVFAANAVNQKPALYLVPPSA
jgi:hypothetical protein